MSHSHLFSRSSGDPPSPGETYDDSSDGAPDERTGENAYRISVAVAGFTDDDLSIEAKENTLTIRGERQLNDEKSRELLYRGIAARTFERSFQLADYVEVRGARLENGLLHVDLVREIPEVMKARAIPIMSPQKVLEVQPTKVAA